MARVYRVMAVLMNYKRTVEDFHRCGAKSSTVYGLPFISDCVGTLTKVPACVDERHYQILYHAHVYVYVISLAMLWCAEPLLEVSRVTTAGY